MSNTMQLRTHEPSSGARPIEASTLRAAMSRFATGVTVVTTIDGRRREGLTINSFSSLSLEPPLVLWCIRKDAASLVTFSRASCFAVNVLAARRRHLSDHFARSHPDKFSGIDFTDGIGGCPVLSGNLASFECVKAGVIEGGDHLIILGEIRHLSFCDDEPLVFSQGRYCTLATS
jgi:flavin reductase (DIM6/NTAB) family NADH-FMN oxidoreductase RutF